VAFLIPFPPIAAVQEARDLRLQEVARSGFEMKGTPFSRARLEVDGAALRSALAATGRPGEVHLDRALRLIREGKVRFRIFQSWETSVSGARRKEFNLIIINGNWPQGVPPELKPAVDRYLQYVTRDVDQGMHWEFEGGGGRPLRARYNDEPWVTLGGPPMVRLVAAMYLEGADTLPGTRADFRAGLKAFLERAR
jgi:hypothetical protein